MSEETTNPGTSAAAGDDRLQIQYQKSPQYRTIHCDGAYGGLTPRGYLSFTIYNERNTLPRRTSRTIERGPDGTPSSMGPEQVEETLGGIMRQLEATVVMDVNAAREFYTWFTTKLRDLEAGLGIPEAERVVRVAETGSHEH